MKYPFTTRKQDVTKEDWYDEFCFPGGYIEYVDMKCTKCGFETQIEADNLFEYFNPRKEDYPEFSCAKCNKYTLVPKDIYQQVKDGFYYPFNDSEDFGS